MHALSDAMPQPPAPGPGGAPGPSAAPGRSPMPLAIHQFHLDQSRFQILDYDVQETGFVIEFDQIEARIEDIALPPGPVRTRYRVEAKLPQGRAQRAASFEMSGWTVFGDYETDARWVAQDLSLPYFRPYYAQVTPAEIEEGRLSSRAVLRIHDKSLRADVELEAADLYFRSYEEGDQLFGLKAEEILAFLKDSAGRLKLPIVLEWDLAERGVERRAVVRRAIERSLKKTLLGNVSNLLERTIQKYSDADMGQVKDEWDDTLKKVKKLLR
jgi:hypothetical protein